MKVTIYSEGEHRVRAIVDCDTADDLQIEAGSTLKLGTPGGRHAGRHA